MILFTTEILDALRANGKATAETMLDEDASQPDPAPVVKIFDPCGSATWLISESDPDEPDRLFGLCDLGMGYPELGYVLRSELEAVKGRFGLGLERDLHFAAQCSISTYADAARKHGGIVESADKLDIDSRAASP